MVLLALGAQPETSPPPSLGDRMGLYSQDTSWLNPESGLNRPSEAPCFSHKYLNASKVQVWGLWQAQGAQLTQQALPAVSQGSRWAPAALARLQVGGGAQLTLPAGGWDPPSSRGGSSSSRSKESLGGGSGLGTQAQHPMAPPGLA